MKETSYQHPRRNGSAVAQIGNLLFRRLAVGKVCGLPIRDTADSQSALQIRRGSWFVIAALALALFWAQMAQAQTHTVIKSFGIQSKVTGLNPRAPLVQGPDGTLYGTTLEGDGYGTVFKLQPDGTGFSVLKSFINSADGAYPCAGLVLSGGTLYGTTRGMAQLSGSSGYGSLNY